MRKVLATTLVGVAVLAACTPAETPSPSPSETAAPSPTVSASASASPSAELTPSAEPSPSPSASPTGVESFEPAPATETAEQAEVRAAWMEYWRIYEKYRSDPTLSDLTETQEVTAGDRQNDILSSISQLRESGLASAGGVQFRDIVVSDATTSADGPVATVEYCLDRSAIRTVVVATGEPAEVDRSFDLHEKATLLRGEDGKWRVSDIRNEKANCR